LVALFSYPSTEMKRCDDGGSLGLADASLGGKLFMSGGG
jgi:hypothetical protein